MSTSQSPALITRPSVQGQAPALLADSCAFPQCAGAGKGGWWQGPRGQDRKSGDVWAPGLSEAQLGHQWSSSPHMSSVTEGQDEDQRG